MNYPNQYLASTQWHGKLKITERQVLHFTENHPPPMK